MNGIWTPDQGAMDHLARARAALSANRLEVALRGLMDGFLRVQSVGPRGVPLPAGWPEADQLLLEISRPFGRIPSPRSFPDGPDVFVATRLYAVGGHTAVLNDYFRASDAGNKHILLTGIAGDATINKALGIRLGETVEAVEVCPVAGLVETTTWLRRRLEELAPRRIFLFHHPEDAVAVAGVISYGADNGYLVHHADGAPSAGLHVPGFRVIDLAPFPAWFSRDMLGLKNLYLPLAVDDPGPPPARSSNKSLRTCTHGSVVKFTDTGQCAFASVITRVLLCTGGDHLHVGPLEESRMDMLRAAMEQEGISPDRFIHIKRVPSLVPAFREHGVDLSLGSFPIGGARGHIDMMSGGIPHFIYLDHPEHAPWKLHLLVPGARHWTSLEELAGLLEGVSREWLADQSALMREHFLRYYDARDFRRRLAALDDPSALPPVPSMPAETRRIWLAAAGAAHYPQVWHEILSAIDTGGRGWNRCAIVRDTMDTLTFNVAVYGLGIIGSRAAENLIRRGHAVAVWNRTPKPELPGFDPDVASVARSSRVHQIFLRDEEAVDAVLARMLAELGAGHIVLVHATVSPEAMKRWCVEVEATGAGFLDAPFTGSRIAAEQGKLVYYVGGDEGTLGRVLPVLDATSRAVHHFGPVGHATVLKIATNMVTAATVQALAEAMVVTRAGGVDVKLFAEAVAGNACRSGTSDLKLPAMLAGDFLPHFSLKNMLKDARLAAALALEAGAKLPAHAATTAKMEELVARGEATAESDFSILARQWDPD